ncbi:MAG: T9SS type A sorting domain-containing protein, partial [candidate division WOR-3 bacterium]
QLETKLYNPFPNPFFHKTRILFSLKNQSNVKLFIYDRMGRIIKILINENKKPGIYSVNWQGENNFQQKVNPGIYFSKFQTGDYYEIKKITFIW